MSSHIGIIVIRGFLPKKEAAAEELGGHSSSAADPNILLEQVMPRCMPTYLPESFIILCLQLYCALTFHIILVYPF
jgi:hypothetical protein